MSYELRLTLEVLANIIKKLQGKEDLITTNQMDSNALK